MTGRKGQAGRRFVRTIGIHYSGAETAGSSQKGLRVYRTLGAGAPEDILQHTGPRKYWTRQSLADWLVATLGDGVPTIAGIDHGFSMPLRWFEAFGLDPDWDTFLADFCAHWPTDEPNTYVDFVRDGSAGAGALRTGNPDWRRLTEQHLKSARSMFLFEGKGSIAKATHAGLPWLRRTRAALPDLHIWPFDGWTPPPGASVLVEVAPRLWTAAWPREGRSPDQHDAWTVARWLKDSDENGRLEAALRPPDSPAVAAVARLEGWVLGT